MAIKEELQKEYLRVMNKVAKWRSVYAGWQLGTRPKDDAEGQAVRDASEQRILQRVELNALIGLLIKKGVFTETEWTEQAIEEAMVFDKVLETFFPGLRSDDTGIIMDIRASETMKGWHP